MTLLSYDSLIALQDNGVIRNSKREHVNASSIDVTLGCDIIIEDIGGLDYTTINLRDRQPLTATRVHITEESPLYLRPGEFVLAHTEQTFYLPNTISAEYKLKSSMARIGLEHLNAGWCDAGWHGSALTLELKNMTRNHTIVLYPGDAIGQMVFFTHNEVPAKASYGARGRYNNDPTVTGAKKSPFAEAQLASEERDAPDYSKAEE